MGRREGTYERLLVGGTNSLDLLLQQRQVLVGRGQLRPEVTSASRLSVTGTGTAHGILLLLAVLLVLRVRVTGLRAVLTTTILLLLLIASVLVVVALARCRTDVLLSIRVCAPRGRDHAIGRRGVGGLLRWVLVPASLVSEVSGSRAGRLHSRESSPIVAVLGNRSA